jgi:hypothetical protein
MSPSLYGWTSGGLSTTTTRAVPSGIHGYGPSGGACWRLDRLLSGGDAIDAKGSHARWVSPSGSQAAAMAESGRQTLHPR